METHNDLAIANINQFLKDNDVSQAALARKAKIGAISLNRILKRKKGLGNKLAKKIADAMGISIGELYRAPTTAAPAAQPKPPTRSEMLGRISIALSGLSDKELSAVMNTVESKATSASKKTENQE